MQIINEKGFRILYYKVQNQNKKGSADLPGW